MPARQAPIAATRRSRWVRGAADPATPSRARRAAGGAGRRPPRAARVLVARPAGQAGAAARARSTRPGSNASTCRPSRSSRRAGAALDGPRADAEPGTIGRRRERQRRLGRARSARPRRHRRRRAPLGRGRRRDRRRAPRRRRRRVSSSRPSPTGRRSPPSCRSARRARSCSRARDIADPALPDALRGARRRRPRGRRLPTVEAPAASRAMLAAALDDGPVDALVLTSGSTARGLARPRRRRRRPRPAPRHAGRRPGGPDRRRRPRGRLRPVLVAPAPDAASLAAFTAPALGAARGAHPRRPGRRPASPGPPPREEPDEPRAPSAAPSTRRPNRSPSVDPAHRLRRTRRTEALRALVRETRIHPRQLVAPMFVRPGRGRPRAHRLDARRRARDAPTRRVRDVERLEALGVGGVILFGLPAGKDAVGTGGWVADGIVQETLRRLRDADLDLVLIADTCLCEYTDHGHCGPLARRRRGRQRRHDRAARPDRGRPGRGGRRHRGAERDDGRPGRRDPGRASTRPATQDTAILAYAAKTASAFYGPFRDAAGSAPALRRPARLPDGPGQRPRGAARDGRTTSPRARTCCWSSRRCPSLDIVAAARARFDVPIGAYQVSGEYASIEAAAERGWLDRRRAHTEAVPRSCAPAPAS